MDDPIEALESRRSWMDKDVTFTKRGLIDFIENTLRDNNPEDGSAAAKEWSEKVHQKGEFQCWVRKGSVVEPKLLCFRANVWFNKGFKLNRVVKSLYDPAHRSVWDKKQLAEMSSKDTEHPNVRLNYYRYKKVLIFSPKDYGDKQIVFAHDGAMYCYSTTNGKGSEEQPPSI